MNFLVILLLILFISFNINLHLWTDFGFIKNLNKSLNDTFCSIFNNVRCEKLIYYFSYIIHVIFMFLFILIISKTIKEKKNKIMFLLLFFFIFIFIYTIKDLTFFKNLSSCIHAIFCIGFKNFLYSKCYYFLLVFFIFIIFYAIYLNKNLVSFLTSKIKLFNFYNINPRTFFSKSNFWVNYNNLIIIIRYYYTVVKTFFLKNKGKWRPTFKKFSFFDVFLKNKNKWNKK